MTTRATEIEGAHCYLDKNGEVRCDFAPPKRSRVTHAIPNDRPAGLPPSCVVDLNTGKWACPGHAIDGTDANVSKTFADQAGHHWAVAGDSSVVVPAVRSVSVGAEVNGEKNSGNEIHEGRLGHPAFLLANRGTQQRMPHRNNDMTPEQMMAARRGVSVGQDMVPAALGQGGYPVGPMGGCAPQVPMATNLAQPCSAVQQCFTTMGIACGVGPDGQIYSINDIGKVISPIPDPTLGPAAREFLTVPRTGFMTIRGIKFFNPPGSVNITGIYSGDLDYNQLLGPIDAATYNTDECFCPVDFGCISVTNGLRITATAIYAPTEEITVKPLNGVIWGTRVQNLYGCTPLNSCGY